MEVTLFAQKSPASGVVLLIHSLIQASVIFTVFSVVIAQDTIVLDQRAAIEIALKNHPQLRAVIADREAAEGRVIQASLRPNPEVNVEIENDLDNSQHSEPSVKGAEVISEASLSISQTFELAGKRDLRVAAAKAGAKLLDFDESRLRLDISTAVKREFTLLLGAQERCTLRQQAYDLSFSLTSATTARVLAGDISPIEETRARVALAGAKADLETAKREVSEAKKSLASAMGLTSATLGPITGKLEEWSEIPKLNDLQRLMANNPDISRWEAEKKQREAILKLEQALAVEDVTITAGLKRAQHDRANLFFAGITIPIPLNNKNRGSIVEATAGTKRVTEESRLAELTLGNELTKHYDSLLSFAQEAKSLREEALLSAQQAYDAVNEGYRLGKFRYVDIIDASNALVETRLRYLETLTNLNLAKLNVERLSGVPGTGHAQLR